VWGSLSGFSLNPKHCKSVGTRRQAAERCLLCDRACLLLAALNAPSATGRPGQDAPRDRARSTAAGVFAKTLGLGKTSPLMCMRLLRAHAPSARLHRRRQVWGGVQRARRAGQLRQQRGRGGGVGRGRAQHHHARAPRQADQLRERQPRAAAARPGAAGGLFWLAAGPRLGRAQAAQRGAQHVRERAPGRVGVALGPAGAGAGRGVLGAVGGGGGGARGERVRDRAVALLRAVAPGAELARADRVQQQRQHLRARRGSC